MKRVPSDEAIELARPLVEQFRKVNGTAVSDDSYQELLLEEARIFDKYLRRKKAHLAEAGQLEGDAQ